MKLAAQALLKETEIGRILGTENWSLVKKKTQKKELIHREEEVNQERNSLYRATNKG